jgi:hypothetical protein
VIQTKWPRLIVVGQPVSEAQADEILIRTNGWWYLFSNDKQWERQVYAVAEEFGYPRDVAGDDLRGPRAVQEWMDRLGMLSLNYLTNSRIVSSYIGGPHGWCDWDGQVGSVGYNIGKWPSDEEVTEDWEAIAAAFPFLDLTAQCIEDEGEGAPAAQWRMSGGRVDYDPAPSDLLAAPVDDFEGNVQRLISDPFRERGVSVERLRQALGRVAS